MGDVFFCAIADWSLFKTEVKYFIVFFTASGAPFHFFAFQLFITSYIVSIPGIPEAAAAVAPFL